MYKYVHGLIGFLAASMAISATAKTCFVDDGLTPGQKTQCIRPVLVKLCQHAGLQSCRENSLKNVVRYRIIEEAYNNGEFNIENEQDVNDMVNYLISTTNGLERNTYDDGYIAYLKAMMARQEAINKRNP